MSADGPKILLQKRNSAEKLNSGNQSNSAAHDARVTARGRHQRKPANSITSSSTSLASNCAPSVNPPTLPPASTTGFGGIEVINKLFPPPPPSLNLKQKTFFHLLEFNSKNRFEELEAFDPKAFPLQNPTTLAIGVIGRHGSGKTSLISALMDLLLPPSTEKKSSSGGGGLVLKKPIQGIDCYCADNIMFLDTFPLFSHPERMAKKGFTQEYLDILVKKMLLFILSTCQVVLVLLESKPEDDQVFQLVAKVQALKRELAANSKRASSSTTNVDAEIEDTDLEPHVIPIYNKCKPDQFSLPAFETAKEKIQSILHGSHLNFSYSIPPLKLAQTLLSDSPRTISPVNYYALPFRSSKNSNNSRDDGSNPASLPSSSSLKAAELAASWSVPATYPVALKQLFRSLLLIPNFNNKPRYCISFREWYQQAFNTWNGIQRIVDEKFL